MYNEKRHVKEFKRTIGDVEVIVRGPVRGNFVWPTSFSVGDSFLQAKAFYDWLHRRQSWKTVLQAFFAISECADIVLKEGYNLGSIVAQARHDLEQRCNLAGIWEQGDIALDCDLWALQETICEIGEPAWIYQMATTCFDAETGQYARRSDTPVEFIEKSMLLSRIKKSL